MGLIVITTGNSLHLLSAIKRKKSHHIFNYLIVLFSANFPEQSKGLKHEYMYQSL
jgi:hypothetical protein